MKPGATTRPLTSTTRAAGSVIERGDADDGVALDGDVGAIPRAAGAVDDAAVAEDQIVGWPAGPQSRRRQKKANATRRIDGSIAGAARSLLPLRQMGTGRIASPYETQPPCSSLLLAQAAHSRPFKSGVNLVEVDVVVTDKAGQPVRGLRREDFEVTEDGKPVERR